MHIPRREEQIMKNRVDVLGYTFGWSEFWFSGLLDARPAIVVVGARVLPRLDGDSRAAGSSGLECRQRCVYGFTAVLFLESQHCP